MTETFLRGLAVGDLVAVARIHRLAFPDSALTHLGHESVRRYYEWLLTGPHDAIALGAFQGGNLVGFCFGGIFRGALSGFVEKNKGFLLAKVLSHPGLVLKADFRSKLRVGLTAAGLSKRKRQPTSSHFLRGNSFGILSIAVSPESQGSGVGNKLMSACELFALDHKFDEMLLTVQPQNQQAVGFYTALGWKKIPPDAGWSGKMYKNLKGA